MKKYKFWSIAKVKTCCIDKKCVTCFGSNRDWVWLCIPPDERYIPNWYPNGALRKKHEEEWLPPPSYWLDPDYESIVYNS